MHSYLKKASQKLTEDPDAEQEHHEDKAGLRPKETKAKSTAKAGGKAPAQQQKNTGRKKV